MSIQTENLKGIDQISVQDLLRPFEVAQEKNLQSLFSENMQLRDQVAMLEAEVDKQDKLIKLLAEALFLTYGGKDEQSK
jgi:cell division protein FtsB